MKKLIFLFWLFSLPAFAQNCARMVTGVNAQTGTSYTMTSLDAVRLTTFSNANPVAVSLPSGLTAGFGACAVFSVQNLGAGTVTITCASCTISSTGLPASTLALTAGAGADIYSAGQNYSAQTGSGAGGGGGLVSAVFGRIGSVSAASTDYGSLATPWQQVGNITSTFAKNAGGRLVLGSPASRLTLFADSDVPVKISLTDASANYFLMGTGNSGNGILQMGTNTGNSGLVPGANIWLDSEAGSPAVRFLFGLNASVDDYDFDDTSAVFSRPLNFTGAQNLLFSGSAGTPGQCLLSNGTKWAPGACASGTVSSVSGTVNQILSSGGGTPVVSLASPLTFPGNLNATQLANGDDLFTLTRKTDTLPTGRYLNFKSAGGSSIASVDIAGNGAFTTLATTDATFAGHVGFTQGPDFTASCPANTVCHQAGTSIGTTYTVTEPSAGPGALSVKTSTALAGAGTTEAYVPVTGNSAHVTSADGTVAACASGVIATTDGAGNAHCSGVNISTVLPSVQGPSGGAYTNSANNVASTVMTYSTSIPAASTVVILCTGSYKFTVAVNTPEFGLNFSGAPTTLFENVYQGINLTTQTGTFGRTTTNGSLVTAASTAASTGVYYAVRIEAGVTTNAATTFTIQGAQASNAGGSVLNVDQNGFTCSVK
jgi:hypothetical protein